MKTKILYAVNAIKRMELKKIKGGDNLEPAIFCYESEVACSFFVTGCGNQIGHCEENSIGQCICVADCVSASVVHIPCQQNG